MSNDDKERALIYDVVYGDLERQTNLRFLEVHIQAMLRGLRVLDIAAGTG